MGKRYTLHLLFLLWLLAMLPTGRVAGQSADTIPSDSPLAIGRRAFYQGDFKTACEAMEKAYKENSQDTSIILLLTESCIRSHDFRRAEQVIEAGAKIHPENGQILLKQGIVRNLRGKFKEAQVAFQQAHEFLAADSPDRPSLYINLGLAITNDNRPVDALPWFDLAIELSPRNATAYTCKGAALYRIGDYIESAITYDRAIELDRTNALSYYNRGMALLRGGDAEKGCADFHTACRMNNMNACKAIVVECAKRK